LKTEELDLSKLLGLGRINDTVEEQARMVEAKLQETTKESVDMIKSKRNYNSYKYNNQKQTLNTKTVQNSRNGFKSTNGRVCFYCGGKYPHDADCPAKGKNCSICHNLNHFAKVCKSKNHKNDNTKREDIQYIEQPESSDKDYIFSIQNQAQIPTVNVYLNVVMLNMKIDTGASINVKNEIGYESLQARPNLCKSVTPTFSYNSTQPLAALGKFNAHIQHGNQSIQAEFVVMKGTSGNLLGFATSQKLKIVKINTVETIETNQKDIQYWKDKFPSVL
jgi:hypothetical protein